MNNVDPFNNFPKSKTPPTPTPQYNDIRPPSARSNTNGQRPVNNNNNGLDLQTENYMLRSDLMEAIAYMQKHGLPWPPKK